MKHLKALFQIFLLALTCFTLFRFLLLVINLQALSHITEPVFPLLMQAFFIGLRFDTVIICSILALPVVAGSLLYVCCLLQRRFINVFYLFFTLLFGLTFLFSSIDLPFFSYFSRRLNSTLLLWNNAGGMSLKMVVSTPRFILFFFLYLLVLFSFSYFLRRIYRHHITAQGQENKRVNIILQSAAVFFLWGLLLLGIRGRISEKSPLIAGSAFFCAYPFINQLGLNPVFTFFKSYTDDLKPECKKLQWLDDREALSVMQAALPGHPGKMIAGQPLRRIQISAAPYRNYNVVLIIMESMAAHRMQRYGNGQNLTPFLDSLAGISLSFDNTFSAGIHTFNGIYSSLYGHPALMNKHTMDMVEMPQMEGLPNLLAQRNYHNIFFTTHDELFDNMSGFLLANGFHTIVGQKNYPRKEVKSTLGVPDEFMFRFSIPEINKISAGGQPFLATFMTGSNHDPHIIPTETGFTQRSKDDALGVIEYADWSVRRFMNYASAQPWYHHTLFVFVADHGVPLWNDPYDVPFTYHRIPFFIFSPDHPKGQSFKQLALQTDVSPTVMSLLDTHYSNATLGIDLLSEQHEEIVFSSDNVLACMNDSLLYIYRKDGSPGLYKYPAQDKTDYSSEYTQEAARMRKIAFSWLQTSQYILNQ